MRKIGQQFWRKFSVLTASLSIVTVSIANPQDINGVTGMVRARTEGAGIPGVTVSVKGTSLGTVTDLQGKFSIKASAGAILVFRCAGFDSCERRVSGQVMDLVMETRLSDAPLILATNHQIKAHNQFWL